MIIETAVPFEELEEIRGKSGASVRLTLLETLERNGIVLNRVLVEGPLEEVERFMEKLRLARAGG
ncbi:TIGR04140 family protein [Thermococcus sp. 21S7]|uniref:TIGR04140 family protein n=1 Tax=Thermococcus sp. 21S7 TaxID=1638221 RepID=UPI0016A7CBFF|nr:TIGR04140 family protein [Thermococcus sp. 21S7]NJE61800.1 TIGR04140 family protein [Thermococcus sp. 21S7]